MKALTETKLSLAELSRITGLDASVIGKIKRGKQKGSPETRARILRAINERERKTPRPVDAN